MAIIDKRTALTFKLYIKLCFILAPSFLIASALGLYFLTSHIIDTAEGRLSVRIGNATARLISGLERLSDADSVSAGRPIIPAEEMMEVLMADPAISCIVLNDAITGDLITQVPIGVGCAGAVVDSTLTMPLYFPGDAQLVVKSSLEEIAEARQTQLSFAALILFAGLIIALITNWLTFRIIIGRHLISLISEIDDAREKAEKSALHDSLTGLANRRYLDRDLAARLDTTRSRPERFAVLQIDLDHFKEINDTLGHDAGDIILRHVAEALKAETRREDFTARIGGDEFVVVTPDLIDHEELSLLANRIIRAASRPITYKDQRCAVGASVGIDIVDGSKDQSELSAQRVLMNADIALYQAKENGRGCCAFFQSDLRAQVEARKKLADDLRGALERGEIINHYQPQFDIAAKRIVSVEALVRWKHPEMGLLTPDDFLPTAERLSLCAKIDELVLKQAIADLQKWDLLGIRVDTISVNVSSSRLADPDLIPKLMSLRLPRGRIVFEVLETAFVDELSDQVRWNLDGVRELGIELEIDDFGTGKASILGVIALAPSRLKVAKEIILPLLDATNQMALVKAILSLGHALDVGMVAEGVETQEHYDAVAPLGFARLQGYFLARPMDAAALEEFLDRYEPQALLR